MALADDLKAMNASFNDAINKVAAEIGDLKSQIKNSMTDTEVADIKAGFQATIDRLTALGADPVNPVPPTP